MLLYQISSFEAMRTSYKGHGTEAVGAVAAQIELPDACGGYLPSLISVTSPVDYCRPPSGKVEPVAAAGPPRVAKHTCVKYGTDAYTSSAPFNIPLNALKHSSYCLGAYLVTKSCPLSALRLGGKRPLYTI